MSLNSSDTAEQGLSYPREKIHVVLLEGIHQSAVNAFKDAGYVKVTHVQGSPSPAELQDLLLDAHIVGVRSRTQLTAEVLQAAPKLLAVGCFCIGTNQVDLDAAQKLGIPVFNAPHSNTRSVAELVLAETVMLFRGLGDKSAAAHKGEWHKSAKGSFEVRGKTIGIVGYGHIGSQVSILAEAFGLRVLYFDVESKLPMGNAEAVDSLADVLARSDVVTLHVPAHASTVNLMDARAIAQMKKGSVLINASRGNVVDIEALAKALQEEHLLGAAVDVFPKEPGDNQEAFTSPLQGLNNVILTPHIGGSTLEAQRNIGVEVAKKLVAYSDLGGTLGAVNFPCLSLMATDGHHRLVHVHQNQPGVLGSINKILADAKVNILAQHLGTLGSVGYVVIDMSAGHPSSLRKQLQDIPGTIRARILF